MAKAKDTSGEKQVHDGPAAIILELKTSTGEVWGQITAPAKEFSTGSLGYYANGKVIDPKTGSRYQVGCNIILIGSKK
ncbi:MAG: hypothetical protein K2X29_06640 [Candidatus Obscuribacterales bacterium]|nr:hypothetical protein [Candidatus Obscuribacterales bacterium]